MIAAIEKLLNDKLNFKGSDLIYVGLSEMITQGHEKPEFNGKFMSYFKFNYINYENKTRFPFSVELFDIDLFAKGEDCNMLFNVILDIADLYLEKRFKTVSVYRKNNKNYL